MELTASALTVGYRGKALISGIDLAVEKGKIITLIGPNGSGKSTILKTLTRQLARIAGVVLVENQDLDRIRHKELATHMSVMLTERVIPELMTCYEVAAMGRYPYTSTFGRLTGQDRAVVAKSLRLVRVEGLAHCLFSQISDGQRQRVLLARALCQQPDVIVLDEPTSYLDVRHKIELLDILRRMASKKEAAVLMSLHEIDLAAKISDWIICVEGDRIRLQGPAERVFQDAEIQAIFGLESGSYNTLFGSVELPAPAGEPAYFILAGLGKGIPLYRLLQKHGRSFSTGILFENDADWQVARVLSRHVVTAPAFEAPADEDIARARELIRQAPCFVDAGTPIRRQNARYRELLDYARQLHKPVMSAEELQARLAGENDA